jgi:hypothetical protein
MNVQFRCAGDVQSTTAVRSRQVSASFAQKLRIHRLRGRCPTGYRPPLPLNCFRHMQLTESARNLLDTLQFYRQLYRQKKLLEADSGR